MNLCEFWKVLAFNGLLGWGMKIFAGGGLLRPICIPPHRSKPSGSTLAQPFNARSLNALKIQNTLNGRVHGTDSNLVTYWLQASTVILGILHELYSVRAIEYLIWYLLRIVHECLLLPWHNSLPIRTHLGDIPSSHY